MFDPATTLASLTARAETFAVAQDHLAAQSKEDREHWHHVAVRDLLRELAAAITASRRQAKEEDATALRTALVAMSLASALPGVNSEYDFGPAIAAVEARLSPLGERTNTRDGNT